MVKPFDIRVMSALDLARALDWAAAEGWNPGLGDARAFQIADPQGFLVGLLDGEPVGCVSVVRYGADFGFLGFYITTPRARGKGYGIQLWNAGMARLRGRNVGLDGVPAQQDNYRKSGFRLAWRNIRYQGPAAARGLPPPSVALVDANALPFDGVAAYDRRFFPAPRDGFLAHWIGVPGHVALAAIRDGALVGLGVIRPCRAGFKIGPLYAADTAIAGALIGGLCERVGPGVIALDVPETNARAVHLAESLGMVPAFETARMYTGADPEIDAAGLFGVTTFELG
jgi:GNAT superfamily N-acetyltransferase